MFIGQSIVAHAMFELFRVHAFFHMYHMQMTFNTCGPFLLILVYTALPIYMLLLLKHGRLHFPFHVSWKERQGKKYFQIPIVK